MKTKLLCTAILVLAASSQALAQETLTAGCINELAFEPRLAVISDKVNLTGAEQGVRSADRVATAQERAAVALWAHLRQQCFEFGDAQRRASAKPQQVAVTKSVFGFQQRLLVSLEQGRLTFAEFNRERLDLASATGQEI